MLKKLDPEGLTFAAVVDVALGLRSSSVLLLIQLSLCWWSSANEGGGYFLLPNRVCAFNARRVKGSRHVPVEDYVFFDDPPMLWLLRHGCFGQVKTVVPLLAFIDPTIYH